jgi:hypothetical protein
MWLDFVVKQEMENHPFFMTKAPEAGEPLSPLMEGLQQLKYSETDNTPPGTITRPIRKTFLHAG